MSGSAFFFGVVSSRSCEHRTLLSAIFLAPCSCWVMEASESQVQAWLDLGLPESPEELGDSPQAARCKRLWARQLQSFQAWEQSTDLDATTVIHIGDDDSEPCSSPPMRAPSSASPHSPLPGTSRTPESTSWSPHCLRAAASSVTLKHPSGSELFTQTCARACKGMRNGSRLFFFPVSL